MNKNIPLIVSGFIFAIVALLHLIRYFLNIELIAQGYPIPMVASLIGFIIATLLSIWMFLAAKN